MEQKICPVCEGPFESANAQQVYCGKSCKWRANKRTYYYRHQEEISERGKVYYQKNADKVISAVKARYKENAPEIIRKNVEYARKHPESTKARQARYRASHLAELNADWHKRRAKAKGNGGSHTNAEWLELVDYFNSTCVYCGEKGRMTKDHIWPIELGGTDYIWNIIPACLSCNSGRCNRLWVPKFIYL